MKDDLSPYLRVPRDAAPLSLRGFLHIAPRRLVERFGPPDAGSADLKVTGMYCFKDAQQQLIQIYDWKATTLYDARPHAGTLSVVDFWECDVPQEFSVAAPASVDLAAFMPWLEANAFRATRI